MATSIPVLLVCRAVVGFCKQTISVAYAYCGDTTTPERRSFWLGMIGVAAASGFIVGPAVGGWLAAFGGNQLPAYCSALVYVCDFIFVWLYVPESNVRKPTDKTASAPRSMWSVFQLDGVASLLVVYFLFNLGFLIMRNNFNIFNAERFQFGPQENGLALSYIGILSLIAKGVVVPMTTAKCSESTLLRVGLIFMTAALAALVRFNILPSFCLICYRQSFVYNVFAYGVVLAPFVFATSIIQTCVIALLTKTSSSEHAGVLLGVASAVESVTRVLAPSIAGALLQHSTGAPPLVGAAAAALCWLYVVMMLRTPAIRHVDDVDEIDDKKDL